MVKTSNFYSPFLPFDSRGSGECLPLGNKNFRKFRKNFIELFTWYAFIHIWHDGDKQTSANNKTRIHFTVVTLHLIIFYFNSMSHIKFSRYTHMIYHIINLITSNICSIRRQKEPIVNVLALVQLYFYYLFVLFNIFIIFGDKW